MNIDCEQCGKRVHVFWEDPIGKFIEYLRLSRQFADKIYVISHNSRGYDVQFLLRRFLELRWIPELIMDGTKILSMRVENLNFVDSHNFLPMSLKACPNHLTSMQERALPPFLQHGQQFGLCGPSSWTQVLWGGLCLVTSVPNFWTSMRGKKTKFSVIRKNCWSIAWMM